MSVFYRVLNKCQYIIATIISSEFKSKAKVMDSRPDTNPSVI